jgi:hypothetical protein
MSQSSNRRAFLDRPLAASSVPSVAASKLAVGATFQRAESPAEVFDRFLTPNRLFFVRNHFGPPELELSPWNRDGRFWNSIDKITYEIRQNDHSRRRPE